jgi:hypothetical protein
LLFDLRLKSEKSILVSFPEELPRPKKFHRELPCT